MILIQQLTKTYSGNIQALCGIDLTIGTGMFGLVGPNGAGKTTLMRILAGLIRPTDGTVRVFDQDITTAKGKLTVKSNLGYLPQQFGVYPDLTAAEFMDYIAVLKGITSRHTRRSQVEKCLSLVHLHDAMERRLKTFSGGMKQRVGIAQALLGQPDLLIVDEPTAGLDPEERVYLRNLLTELAVSRTVILSTHIVEDINQSCNDLAVLQRGKVIFRGTPKELTQRAQGNVWQIRTDGKLPDAGLTIVSTLQTDEGIQYRVLGKPSPALNPWPTEPTLEDSYIWLMQSRDLSSS